MNGSYIFVCGLIKYWFWIIRVFNYQCFPTIIPGNREDIEFYIYIFALIIIIIIIIPTFPVVGVLPHEDSVHLTVFIADAPHFFRGYAVVRLVEALRHKPYSRGFNSFQPHYTPWADSDYNRNEYQG